LGIVQFENRKIRRAHAAAMMLHAIGAHCKLPIWPCDL
jgi:hypothetical protein